MKLITVDLETFYSKEYSLSKLTTEQYIRDPRFQVIGASVKVDDAPAEWFSGPAKETLAFLRSFEMEKHAVLCQNTMFDGAILSWRCGIRPKRLLDTMCMSRALHGVNARHSLAALAERYGVGTKGTEVLRAIGKRRLDFTARELAEYGAYCVKDTELTHAIFMRMLAAGFPKAELQLIDLTLRMFTEPVLELDVPHLEGHLQHTLAAKQQMLTDAGVGSKKDLMSNPKFADMLRALGVEPPTKISDKTGKEAYAMAKTDEAFVALAEHEDIRVQTLMAARLGNKSTIEETRTQRFIGIGKRGSLPIPLRYYAAHTGRWGGTDKLNLQNLPSRGPNAKQIKKSILAPKGYVIIECDSSQIEARVLAWLAGQEDLIAAFARKDDVYKLMASKLFGVDIDDVDKGQRQIGKVVVLGCFAAGTQVLTDRGWIAIETVQVTDRVWDGEEWVAQQGVVPQGVKPVLTHKGVSATLDHEILTELGWRAWSEVCANPHLFQSALRLANYPSSTGGRIQLREGVAWGGSRGADAPVGGRGLSTGITCPRGVALGVTLAPSVRDTQSGTGTTNRRCPIWKTASGCLTGYRHVLAAAITRITRCFTTTEVAEYTSARNGERTVPRFCCTWPNYPDTTTRLLSSIEPITTAGTSPATFGLCQRQQTPETGAGLETCNASSTPSEKKTMTYDIAYAGPRNRYMVKTTDGGVIVHNCGYGIGHIKLQVFLKLQAGVVVSLDEAKRIIDVYRFSNDRISQLWKDAQNTLKHLALGDRLSFGRPGVLDVDPSAPGIILPNGLPILYDGLRAEQGEKGYEYLYDTRQGPTRIYGGKCVENVVQALARIVVGEQMLKISKRYRPVLTVHDSVVSCVPEAEADEAREYIETCMRWTPAWATGLPVNCESGVGTSYGACE
jgi:DNA polymerase III epsilon subunit-like protein